MSSRLRVLVQAFTCCPPGRHGFSGGEDLLGWRVVEQLGRFHDVWVLTDARNRRGIEDLPPHLAPATVHFEYVSLPALLEFGLRFPGSHQLSYYLWQVRAFARAWRLHRGIGFDVAHHLTYANDWMVSFIGALLPIPFIRGPGGGAQRVPRVCLSEFSRTGRVWERVRSVGQWLFRHDPLFLLGQHRASAILVCSHEALEAVPRRWRRKAQVFPVIGIHSDDLEMCSQAPASPPGRFTVLSGGKLLQLKGFQLAIKAFQRFSKEAPAARLDIIGDGPDRPILERLVRSLGLGGQVRLLPWMARPKFLEALRSCDVFLFASLRDGGGAVVLEAMAAGRPVVCLSLGGPAWHVTTDCGLKVAPQDPSQMVRDLALALKRLYLDGAMRREMGQAARRRAVDVYHWDRLGERLVMIYEEALSQRPAASRAPHANGVITETVATNS